MSITLFLARHGASAAYANIGEDENIFRQTRLTKLSEEGRKQAEQLGKQVNIYRPDVLLASPYRRASETANIVVQYAPYLFPNIVEDLREIRRIVDGKNIYGKLNLAYKRWRGEAIRRHDIAGKFHPSDESFGEFYALASRNKYYIQEEFGGQKVLVVGHSQSFAMMITSMLLGDRPASAELFKSFNQYFMNHAGITIMKYETRKWRMVEFNKTSHLH